jgi:HSP20 family protein
MKREVKKGPFGDFERIQARMDRLFGEMMGAGRWPGACHYRNWHPPTDVYETDTCYVVRMEVADMSRSDFNISLSNRTLVITGVREDPAVKQACHQIEICYGEFRSEVTLPGAVDDRRVEATYEDGFLTVVLPKKPAQRVAVTEIRET